MPGHADKVSSPAHRHRTTLCSYSFNYREISRRIHATVKRMHSRDYHGNIMIRYATAFIIDTGLLLLYRRDLKEGLRSTKESFSIAHAHTTNSFDASHAA